MVTNRKIYKGFFIGIVMRNTGNLVGALERVAKDYENVAREAARIDSDVHVPANISVNELGGLINSPEALSSSNDGSEPCYACLEDANAGRNNDGSNHQGYVLVDPISRNVVGLVDRDGDSKITERNGLVKHLSGHDVGVGADVNLKLLAEEKGNYVIVEADEEDRLSLYASVRCRCPCLDANIFWPESFAENIADELQNSASNSGSVYTAAEIDDDFLVEWGLHNKGYSNTTVHVLSNSFEKGSDPVAFVSKYADKK